MMLQKTVPLSSAIMKIIVAGKMVDNIKVIIFYSKKKQLEFVIVLNYCRITS